jgi:hypothetical protein
MLRLLADENLRGDIARGLSLRKASLDIVRAQDVGLTGLEDPDVLRWAAQNQRIVLTHDRATMPYHAFQVLAEGRDMAGVFILNDRLSAGLAIEELFLLASCSEQTDWRERVVHLPL